MFTFFWTVLLSFWITESQLSLRFSVMNSVFFIKKPKQKPDSQFWVGIFKFCCTFLPFGHLYKKSVSENYADIQIRPNSNIKLEEIVKPIFAINKSFKITSQTLFPNGCSFWYSKDLSDLFRIKIRKFSYDTVKTQLCISDSLSSMQ